MLANSYSLKASVKKTVWIDLWRAAVRFLYVHPVLRYEAVLIVMPLGVLFLVAALTFAAAVPYLWLSGAF
ncbi:hypothetical protein [Anaerotruncus rubiinfantis]|uniref:hypothetical protein n=1 Tax=Anaerotruncus rubiinfantis TaxID=1720200 RepID=UPI0008306FC7|nr:hypothetical protein [Anaerotruncus rubiinfantis]